LGKAYTYLRKMMKALFLFGAPVAIAQSCYTQPTDNCTKATSGLDCVVSAARCYRSGGGCDTTMMTCGPMCAAGTSLTDAKSCSKCADSCSTTMDNATCVGAGGGPCSWAPALCIPATTMMTAPCTATTQADCTAQSNCFWVSYNDNQCGVAGKARNFCTPCNGTTVFTTAIRSALANKAGQTCTWAKGDGYANGYSVSISAAAQNSDCAAMTAADSVADIAGIVAFAALGTATAPAANGTIVTPFAATAALPTCATSSNDASSLLPGMALLATIALLA